MRCAPPAPPARTPWRSRQSRKAALGELAEREIAVVVGPEVIAGSTRLKAGTAQKLVLNTISTVAMVRLGKTFGNLMVDVAATNDKLRARVRRIVRLATGAPPGGQTRRSRRRTGTRVAIVSLLAGIDAPTARERLSRERRRAPRDRGAMRLGVEAALVDRQLVPGDVEIGKPAGSCAANLERQRPRNAIAGFRRPAGERFGGVDFAAADIAGYARAGEALLEAGVTAYRRR